MTTRTTARIVGALFLINTVTYTLGDGLEKSVLTAPDYLLNVYPNSTQMVIGVLLQYVAAAGNVVIGVLLFSILRKYSETIALGYVVTRIFDGAGLAVSGIATLSLITLSRQTIQAGTQSASYALTLGDLLVAGSHAAYLVTMVALGLGAMPFCYLLYRSRLIPRSMSILGLIGYAALLVGSSLELFGLDLYMIHYVPGGLFELIFPIWLIVKGFDSSAIEFEPAKSDLNERDEMGLSRA
jgi:Domain of unknown function (DUF4386)